MIRDEIIGLLAAAPAEGMPIAAILQIPNVGGRDGLDHMLLRMIRAGEIVRVGRGRYGLPGPAPAVPIPHDVAPTPAPLEHPRGDVHQHQVAPRPRTVSQALLSKEDFDRLFGHLELEVGAGEIDRCGQRPAESDFDFETFCATISCKYGKYGLCPPFRLRARAYLRIVVDRRRHRSGALH
jgi:hypothetical protein